MAELPFFRLGSTMKDPVSESGEFSDSEANTLEHLCFVVAAFSKAIGVVAVESVQDRFAPVMKSFCTGIKFWQIGVFRKIDPVGQLFPAFFRAL